MFDANKLEVGARRRVLRVAVTNVHSVVSDTHNSLLMNFIMGFGGPSVRPLCRSRLQPTITPAHRPHGHANHRPQLRTATVPGPARLGADGASGAQVSVASCPSCRSVRRTALVSATATTTLTTTRRQQHRRGGLLAEFGGGGGTMKGRTDGDAVRYTCRDVACECWLCRCPLKDL